MAHELEIINGEASMAYTAENGTPWHRLGTPVNGLGSIDDMLAASKGDYEVRKSPTYILDEETGEPIAVDGRCATWRREPIYFDADGQPQGGNVQTLGSVSESYQIIQNRTAVEFAYSILDEAADAERIDTMGVLQDGRTFFASIPLPDQEIDPDGVNDRFKRHLAVVTSHDGTRALTVVNSRVRVVCMNTVQAAERSGSAFRMRHTRNVESTMGQVRRMLALTAKADDDFERVALDMLATPSSLGKVIAASDKIYSWDATTASPAGVTIRDERNDKLTELWGSAKNSEGYGNNAWAAWNTLVEYFDHHTRGSETVRLERQALDGMEGRKVQAKALLMA